MMVCRSISPRLSRDLLGGEARNAQGARSVVASGVDLRPRILGLPRSESVLRSLRG
jgi:hypothetical protein